MQTFKPRYLIRKRLDGSTGVAKQSAFSVVDDWTTTYAEIEFLWSDRPGEREPFALLHGRH